MNVEKMIKRDISVEIANYLTNNLTCYEKKNIDDEKTYETNFLHLMNVIGKNVINIPRKVHYSRELIKKMNCKQSQSGTTYYLYFSFIFLLFWLS